MYVYMIYHDTCMCVVSMYNIVYMYSSCVYVCTYQCIIIIYFIA